MTSAFLRAAVAASDSCRCFQAIMTIGPAILVSR